MMMKSQHHSILLAEYIGQVQPTNRLSLWEIAILKGYDVFLLVMQNNGGVVICIRSTRTIEFAPLQGSGT
jgi:hypothetical protein